MMYHKLLDKYAPSILGAKLIDVQVVNKNLHIHIPENQKWTFSENKYYEENVDHWLEKMFVFASEQFEKPVFFDVGANCGYYSLASSRFMHTTIAFEPTKETQKILRKNISSNRCRNIVLKGIAVSDKKGMLEFNTYNAGGNNSLISRNIPAGHELKFKKKYTVNADTLDNLVVKSNLLPAPTIVKIDVEGAELFTLRGAQKTLRKYKPALLVEYSEATSNDAGYKREEIAAFLKKLGYEIWGLSKDNVSNELIRLNKPNEGKISNIVAIHKDNVFKAIVS